MRRRIDDLVLSRDKSSRTTWVLTQHFPHIDTNGLVSYRSISFVLNTKMELGALRMDWHAKGIG